MDNKIPQYINNWLTIIETMSNQNTYKLAWGRSIVEYVSLTDIDESKEYLEINMNDSAKLVLKYYWNQLFFFKLNQSPENNNAYIIEETNKMINLYCKLEGSNQPRWFQDGYEKLKDTLDYAKSIKKISDTLRDNPAKYFLNASLDGTNKKQEVPIYIRDNINNRILIKTNEALMLKEYGIILIRLLNYKWTQLLEKYNFVPKLSSKVTAISEEKVRRNNLTEYKNQLIKEFKDGKIYDFYDNKELSYKDATVDHVLPWSFMYSDDIWNLVITSKNNNSKKSNVIPSEEVIEKLKRRNDNLIDEVDDKFKKDLLLASKNNYLDKYYYECKVAR